MLINDVLQKVKEIEEEVLFDVEAPSHYYDINYENGKIILRENDEYHFNGDEWGEIEVKTNTYIIGEFDCTIEEYINFIICFYKKKLIYQEHQYPSDIDVITKISIKRYKQ